ncbi:HNH endonuclease [Zhihengliuella halotolerans]|uniref:HNH endonuclease n=1 Tax=Zhihengliuella halotolerans TaxID=370736 RepID=UPI00102B34EE
MSEWSGKRDEVIRLRGQVCYLCGEHVPMDDIHIDHRIPRIHGGSNDFDNLYVSCSTCNLQKGSKSVDEFKTVVMNDLDWFISLQP